MAAHNDMGNLGEELAEKYLLEKGYSICQRDWHYGHRDIDIVAYDGEELVFVEVKTRRNETFALAEDAVDDNKTANLVAAAEAYVRTYKIDNPTRFDVVTVVGDNNKGYKIKHIEDAFLP